MPLGRITLMKGRPDNCGQKVGEVVYQTMVDTINVPANNHFQIICVFVCDGLPSLPLFIIFRKESRKVEIYNSFYLTEPVSKMPYMHWGMEFNSGNQGLFESDHWNMSELFLDYFKKRWKMEKEKLYEAGSQDVEPKDFIYAPKSAREKCTELFTEMK